MPGETPASPGKTRRRLETTSGAQESLGGIVDHGASYASPMSPDFAERRRLSVEEYLAFDDESEGRWTYFEGEMFDMAGATREHALIVGNLLASLHAQLRKKPCEAYTHDIRVRVGDLYTYPDLVVVCGERLFEGKKRNTLVNPTVIVEVLSESTEAFDRGKKAERYRALASLTDLLFVSQTDRHIEHYARGPELWTLRDVNEGALTIGSIGATLTVDDAYERVFEGT
jgi:Uma2 family endonuclease